MEAPFLAGVLAGYAIAIPVGAIAVLIIEQGLRRGFRAGFAAGAGAATADGMYSGLAMIAGATLAIVLEPLTGPFRLLAGVVLLAIAGRGLIMLLRDRSSPATTLGPPVRLRVTYLQFVGLTLLNPQTVVYFAALILGLPHVLGGATDRVAFVAGAFIASLSWQTALALLGSAGHRRLSPRFRDGLSLAGNIAIAAFAVVILAGPR